MDDIDIEDMIDEEDVTITMTHQGYIKRIPSSTYAIQKRGGRGKSGMSTKEEDFVEHIFTTSTHDYLLFFTNYGKVYRKKAYYIPESSRQSKGTAIVNVLQLEKDEKVTTIIPIKEFDERFLVLATKYGVIKKSHLESFDTSRKSGLIAINLNDGDELISVAVTSGEDDIIVVTTNGKSIRFSEEDVRCMGRTATGVRSIILDGDDYVVAMELVLEMSKLLVVSENGFGKQTKIVEYRQQVRGGKGVKTYNISEKTGNLVGAKIVTDEHDIMMVNSEGVIIRLKVSDIAVSGRSTSGVTLMRSKDESSIISIAKVLPEDEEDLDDEIMENGDTEAIAETQIAKNEEEVYSTL